MKQQGIREEIRVRLEAAADPAYREFHSGLLPGTTGILGVRTPALRALARELIKEGKPVWQAYISQLEEAFKAGEALLYDEKILWALCICGGFKTWEEAEPFIRDFIPAIDNWAVCDIFCGSLKQAGKDLERAWSFIQPWLISAEEYELRFGVVMLLSHFTGEAYLEPALKALDGIRHEGYYAKMAVAWAISIYFIKWPGEVMEYLKRSSLDDWTYNKALQKIRESYRVDKDTKEEIRRMKRK